MAESCYNPVYAKDTKDIPDWMKRNHDWQAAVPVDMLPKLQLKVKLCCQKCEEKVIEEIREVAGVFDVRAERLLSKVVVVACGPGLDDHAVLRAAKKIHRKAKLVDLDAKEKPKPKKEKDADDKKKEKDADDKKKEADDKKREESHYNASRYVMWAGPQYPPFPDAYLPGEYRPSQSYAPRYNYPPLPNQPADGFYRQYVYHY